mgnify:CR=1 FL=1
MKSLALWNMSCIEVTLLVLKVSAPALQTMYAGKQMPFTSVMRTVPAADAAKHPVAHREAERGPVPIGDVEEGLRHWRRGPLRARRRPAWRRA